MKNATATAITKAIKKSITKTTTLTLIIMLVLTILTIILQKRVGKNIVEDAIMQSTKMGYKYFAESAIEKFTQKSDGNSKELRRKHMKIKRNLRQRILNKLYNAGYDSEAGIKEMDVHEFMKLPSIGLADINTFLELQVAIRRNKVISFLAGTELDLSPKRKKKESKVRDINGE